MRALFTKLLSRNVLPMCVAAGALVAFSLGFLAGASAVFDMLAQFSAHWLIIAAMAAMACFITKRAYSLLLAGFVIALLFPSVLVKWYTLEPRERTIARALALTSPAAAAPDPRIRHAHRSIKLLTFNLYNPNRDTAAISHEIRRHDADVVLLIEFGRDKEALKADLRQRYPFHRICHGQDCTIGLFSKQPLTDFEVVRPRDDSGPSLVAATIEMDGVPVRIIGTHVLSPNHGPHANFLELDHLARRARKRNMPTIVAGDLNTTVWAHGFDHFRRVSGLAHMGHLIPTWPVRPLSLPQIGIDHVFTSQELRLTGVRSGYAAGSDHLPLVATIELK